MFHVRQSFALRKTMLSPLENLDSSNLALFICSAHCALHGTKLSFTQATSTAMTSATDSIGRTIARKLTPLARIATISEWRQKLHIV